MKSDWKPLLPSTHERQPGLRRVLVVDDNREIHADFRAVLTSPPRDTRLSQLGEELFASQPAAPAKTAALYELEVASSGDAGVNLVAEAYRSGRRFALAFVDMRMPPGADGVATSRRIWEIDPAIHIVICTAYSDFSWSEVLATLQEHSRRLHLLRKPFGADQVRRMADVLSTKWLHENRRAPNR